MWITSILHVVIFTLKSVFCDIITLNNNSPPTVLNTPANSRCVHVPYLPYRITEFDNSIIPQFLYIIKIIALFSLSNILFRCFYQNRLWNNVVHNSLFYSMIYLILIILSTSAIRRQKRSSWKFSCSFIWVLTSWQRILSS